MLKKYHCHAECNKASHLSHISRSFTTVQDDIGYIYTIILFLPVCIDKLLTDIHLLGLEVA